MDYNWLFPGAEARPVGAKGWGSFAVERIPAGTSIAAFGGWVVTHDTLETFSHDRQGRSIQIDEDLYLVSDETPEAGDMLNHSCEPSCGLVGANVLVAMRDIEVGEELTFGYATCDSSDYDEFECSAASRPVVASSPASTGPSPSFRRSTPAGSRPTCRGASPHCLPRTAAKPRRHDPRHRSMLTGWISRDRQPTSLPVL